VERAFVRRLSFELKIAPEQIVREYWELTVLNACGENNWSTALNFKGGTALPLAYGSPRLSYDMSMLCDGFVHAVFPFLFS
jgi:hypothetical protein